jgi:hypothetical protein
LEKLEEKNIRDIELIRWLTNLLVNEYYYQRAA